MKVEVRDGFNSRRRVALRVVLRFARLRRLAALRFARLRRFEPSALALEAERLGRPRARPDFPLEYPFSFSFLFYSTMLNKMLRLVCPRGGSRVPSARRSWKCSFPSCAPLKFKNQHHVP